MAETSFPSQPFLVGIMGLAILNGIFSPATPMAFVFHPLWYPILLPLSMPVAFLIASLMVSTATIMLAGVPAAIYERLTGRGTDGVSWWIWLAGTALLTLPALTRAIAVM